VLALLYDIHGNLPALEAVLEDAAAQGARSFLLGGDYALFGAWPHETVMRLEALEDARWLRGNTERWTANPDQAPDQEPASGAIPACREALGQAAVERLGSLPEQLVLESTRYCHASPVSDMRSFLPEPAEDESELLAQTSEPRLVFGHTHLAFRRRARGPAGDIELVNPGSVGIPLDGDVRAAYALLSPEDELEHRRVAYDHNASAAALRKRFGGPWTEIIARRIEIARA
jgi:diadenosine tetraphosphatase ApaH/serine/threonine PP2A family protein phosphatase